MVLPPSTFRERVQSRAQPSLSTLSLEHAAEFFIQKGHTDETAVGPCLELAALLEEHLSSGLAKFRPTTAESPPTPGEIVGSERIIERIRPWAAEVRRELFGDPEPPFPTYEVAVEWLVKSGDEQRKRWVDEYEKRRKRRLELTGIDDYLADWNPREKLIMDTMYSTGDVFHISYERRAIAYKTSRADLVPAHKQYGWQQVQKMAPDIFPPDAEHRWEIEIYEDSPLATLEREARRLEEALGLDKLDVIAFLLAGIKPIFPPLMRRVEYKVFNPPVGRPVEQYWAIIEIPQPAQLTYKEFKETYRWIRQTFHLTRVKALTKEDQRLLDIVKRLGGVPRKGKQAFWERVRRALYQEGGAHHYRHWRGPSMKYNRLMKKLATAQASDTRQ